MCDSDIERSAIEMCVAQQPALFSQDASPTYESATGHTSDWPVSLPGTPVTPVAPLFDTSCCSSTDVSPVLATPQDLVDRDAWGCPDVYVVPETALSPLPITITQESPKADNDNNDDELEAELLSLLQGTPCPPPQRLMGKSPKGPRSKSTSHRASSGSKPKKRKAVSASAVLAALGVENPFSFLVPSRTEDDAGKLLKPRAAEGTD